MRVQRHTPPPCKLHEQDTPTPQRATRVDLHWAGSQRSGGRAGVVHLDGAEDADILDALYGRCLPHARAQLARGGVWGGGHTQDTRTIPLRSVGAFVSLGTRKGRAGSVVGGEGLVAEHREALFERKLEPIAARHTVPRPVVEVPAARRIEKGAGGGAPRSMTTFCAQ